MRQLCLRILIGASLLTPWGAAWAQDAAPPTARREVRAVRIQGDAPVLDGRLDDAAWAAAPALTELFQKQPKEGEPATERTEVRFLYDEDALYVGARMYSRDPAAIQAPVSRRDVRGQAEHLWVSLDTYLDRRTAYTFGVTAAGTRLDWYHPRDDEEARDLSFDAVWQGEVARDSLGWTAEMRIPFSQLRFTPGATAAWGVNVNRWNPATQEDAFWIPVPSQEQGWSSRMGLLVGIEGVHPSRRIELLPYLATGARFTAEPGPGNPFDDGSTWEGRVGGDVKMGLGPSVTLEGTVNPDFGQVEQDPAEVNLSAFETFFEEKRPFFLEGSQILAGGGPRYFYSRRIGATPFVGVGGDYVDYPRNSTILGATKLTGRLRSGTSVGALAAVTGAENARVFDLATGEIEKVRVSPLTGFGVARAQHQFGPASSTAGLTLTGVRRDLEGEATLSRLLHRQALAGGADWNLRFRGGEYSVSGYAGFSYVEGDSLAILRTQRSSARYFQRPDAGYVRVDPSRTSLAGYAGSLSVARNSGRHWLWELYGSARSPGFEINDAGLANTADDVFGYASLRYRETRPGPLFQRWDVSVSSENVWNFGGVRNFAALRTDMSFTLRSFWRTVLIAWTDLPALSDDLTRGGPLVETGQTWRAIGAFLSPPGKKTRVVTQVDLGGSETGAELFRLRTDLSIRPGPRWQLGVVPTYRRETEPRQYVATLPGGPEATSGRRYVFAFIDRTTLSAATRLNYLFTPDLSLEVYAEPFAASGRYHDFGQLPAPRRQDLDFFGPDQLLSCGDGSAAPGSPCAGERGRHLFLAGGEPLRLARDFNRFSLRSNAVLRWEWRPGSTLFLVWQQDRSGFEPVGSPVGPGSLWETLQSAGDSYLALKVSYWLPVR